MDPRRFDAVSKHFASRRLTRPQTWKQRVSFRQATPDTVPVVDASTLHDKPPSQLFVQSFRSGSITRSATEFGTHTVTLAQGMGQTIVFTDRPSREVFTAPTSAFVDGFSFSANNPPNAAILVDAGDGTTDIAVVELFNTSYDAATHTATYDLAVLANWQNDVEMGFQEEPIDLANMTTNFGPTHLFIDDCPDVTMVCLRDEQLIGFISGLVRRVQTAEGTCELVWPPTLPDYGLEAYCNLHFEQCATRCNGLQFEDEP